jgi:hypothetical protein
MRNLGKKQPLAEIVLAKDVVQLIRSVRNQRVGVLPDRAGSAMLEQSLTWV